MHTQRIRSEFSQELIKRAIEKKPSIRKKKPQQQRFPANQERAYRRYLANYVKKLRELVSERLLPRLEELSRDAYRDLPAGARADAWPTDLARIINGIVVEFGRFYTREELEDFAFSLGSDVSDVNREAIELQMKRLTGVDVLTSEPWLQTQLAAFQQRNYDLIKTIEEREIARLNNIVSNGFAAGDRWETISEEIQSSFDIAESDADRIARDQVSKLNGEMTKLRQSELGIAQYVWSTVGDERVRETHAENDGKTFSWSDPPATGHPGEEINCRCTALPVLPGEEE